MGETLAERLREHAAFCDDAGAPLYAVLMRGMADDLDEGGPVAELTAGWETRPRGSVVQLRILGALHRLVLRRQAPALATFYASVGGTARPEGAWPLARAVLAEHLAQIGAELETAPQTNEVGRSTGLAVGLAIAAQRAGVDRVRLLEIGASAGLNLLVDRFRITAAPTDARDRSPWQWGPAGSPVDLSGSVRGSVRGSAPQAPQPTIVARRGCDLEPVDPRSADGRLWLSSFVWPDHVERFRRLAGALRLAEEAGPDVPVVDRASAGAWLEERLAEPVPDGVLTVVWHSVMWQYLDDAERDRAAAAIEAGRSAVRLAHLRLESATAPYSSEPVLSLDGEPLGTSPPHGVPLRLA